MSITDDGRIEVHEHFECSQQELWDTVSNGDHLSEWFGGAVSIEPHVGGLVRFDLPADGVLATGVVRAWSPPRPGYTVAHLEHTFVDAARPDLAALCNWAVVVADDGCDLHFVMDGAGELVGEPLLDTRLDRTTDDEARAALAGAHSILLVDWVGDETPRTICRLAPVTYGKVGPKPEDWALVEADDSERGYRTTRIPRPDHADLLHLDWTLGFDEFVGVAVELGVKTFWYHSGRNRPHAVNDRGCWVPARQSARQRAIVEGAGMQYVDNHFILDIARALTSTG